MPTPFTKLLGFVIIILCFTSHIKSQISGGSVFLQGCYIELAISGCGVYGTDDPIPSSGPLGDYHPNSFGLGFVADHEKDGWDVSTGAGEPDYCGDYFTPGSPEEGWAVQQGSDTWYNNYVPCDYGNFDIPGEITGYVDTGGYKSGIWEGDIDDISLHITQTTTFPDGALYFLTAIELCNEGAADLADVYYLRNVDPDQDVVECGSVYNTTNYIVNQPPTTDTALITAIGDGCGCFLGIGAIDSRSRVSTGSGTFFTDVGTPEQAWNGTYPYDSSTPVSGLACDCAIQISFKIDLIPAGGCETIYFAHVLDPSDLAQALQATLYGTFGVTADSVVIDTTGEIEICKGDSVKLDVLFGEDYTWTWSPSAGLSVDTGVSVIAHPDTTTVYTILGAGECDTITRVITVIVFDMEGFADAGPDISLCLGDTITLK